jgi:hypothetical protein
MVVVVLLRAAAAAAVGRARAAAATATGRELRGSSRCDDSEQQRGRVVVLDDDLESVALP